MARCRALIASTKLLLSVLSPGGACTVPVPRPWRPLLHVAFALALPIARTPPRRNGEGQRSSDHRRSSLATARFQRRWCNLALGLLQYPTSGSNLVLIRLRRPLRGHAASISKSNVTFSESPARIMRHFFARHNGFCCPPSQTVSPAKKPTGRRKEGGERCMRNRVEMRRLRIFPFPEEAELAIPERVESGGKNNERKGLPWRRLDVQFMLPRWQTGNSGLTFPPRPVRPFPRTY